jgi:hypothetical protein
MTPRHLRNASSEVAFQSSACTGRGRAAMPGSLGLLLASALSQAAPSSAPHATLRGIFSHSSPPSSPVIHSMLEGATNIRTAKLPGSSRQDAFLSAARLLCCQETEALGGERGSNFPHAEEHTSDLSGPPSASLAGHLSVPSTPLKRESKAWHTMHQGSHDCKYQRSAKTVMATSELLSQQDSPAAGSYNNKSQTLGKSVGLQRKLEFVPRLYKQHDQASEMATKQVRRTTLVSLLFTWTPAGSQSASNAQISLAVTFTHSPLPLSVTRVQIVCMCIFYSST